MAIARRVFLADAGRKVVLYLVTNVEDGNSIDLSTDFSKIMDVQISCVTKDPPFVVNYVIAKSADTVSNSLVTFSNQFLSNDALYVIVIGSTAG